VKEVFQTIEAMKRGGVIEDYAVAGAVGAIFYTEPFLTMDVDFIVPFPPVLVDCLKPIRSWLKDKGYEMNEEGFFEITGRPIQFLPSDKDPLTEAAFKEAQYLPFGDIEVRVVRPEYLAAEAVNLGRPKDIQRISMLIESQDFDAELFKSIVKRFSLEKKLKKIKMFLP
jgi:hypothetical protein